VKPHHLRRFVLPLAAFAVCGGLVAAAPRADGAPGWTFRISASFGIGAPDVVLDPALGPVGAPGYGAFGPVFNSTCATLYNYRDRRGRAGGRLVPEVADGPPRLSKNGRTYVFTIRRGFRFDTGAPVTAASFATAINRGLSPMLRSPAAAYLGDVVGASDVVAGTTATPSGVRARGRKLSITLTHPAPDLVARLAVAYFCAIPAGTPVDPSGIRAASAGPYYVANLDQNSLLLKRNRYYTGTRPRRPEAIVFMLNRPLDSIPLEVERGNADLGLIAPHQTAVVAKDYPTQFHVGLGTGVACLALNSSRPLFANNPQLRKAVNLAIDRRKLAAQYGFFVSKRLTDQYLPPTMPGFRAANIYPLAGPDLRKARMLARGHLRTGKAIMYYRSPAASAIARAELVRYDLGRIGISVEIRQETPPGASSRRGEPFDIVDSGCTTAYHDPYGVLNLSFDGSLLRPTGNTNVSYFNSPRFNRRLHAAARLRGAVRYRTYGRVDVDLARGAAPAVAYGLFQNSAFVSQRIGCVTLNPVKGFLPGASCLKRR
jgi:ABC-type transport system substrate-binding protein